MRTSRVAAKTALLAPVGPIEAWGVQQLLGGDPVAGAVAVVFGMALVGIFVALQEYDIPYEAQIIDAIATTDPEQTVDTATDVSERASEEIEDAGGG